MIISSSDFYLLLPGLPALLHQSERFLFTETTSFFTSENLRIFVSLWRGILKVEIKDQMVSIMWSSAGTSPHTSGSLWGLLVWLLKWWRTLGWRWIVMRPEEQHLSDVRGDAGDLQRGQVLPGLLGSGAASPQAGQELDSSLKDERKRSSIRLNWQEDWRCQKVLLNVT